MDARRRYVFELGDPRTDVVTLGVVILVTDDQWRFIVEGVELGVCGGAGFVTGGGAAQRTG